MNEHFCQSGSFKLLQVGVFQLEIDLKLYQLKSSNETSTERRKRKVRKMVLNLAELRNLRKIKVQKFTRFDTITGHERKNLQKKFYQKI